MERQLNKDKGTVVTEFLKSKVCDNDTFIVFEMNVEALTKLVDNWDQELGSEKDADKLLKPFFKGLLGMVKGIVADHKATESL